MIGAQFGERRRAGFDPVMVRRIALVWALGCALLLIVNAGAIWDRRFPDPDDALRLLQVRDLLAGQSWFDLHQYRIDAPRGVPMHWSRLVDLPLLAVIGLLTPLIGSSAAELTAMIVVPLVTLGCVLLLVGRLAWKLADEEIAGLAALTCLMAVPVIHQLRPLRIDHHGWQLVALLVAVNALAARDARRGGWAIGTGLAFGLSISLELLPLAVAIVGLTALRWLRNRADRLWMVATMQALAAVSSLLFLATRGLSDLAAYCDAIAPPHLAVFALGALVVWATASREPQPRALTLAGLALAALGGVATIALAAPQCTTGAFTGLDPLVRTFWFDSVVEGMPIWRQEPGEAARMLAPPLLGLFICISLFASSRDWLRRWWLEYAMLLAAALLVSLFVARGAAAAGVLAALPIGLQLRSWIRTARNARHTARRVLVLGGIVLALAPALPLTLLMSAAPGRARTSANAVTAAAPIIVSGCAIETGAVPLAGLEATGILAPLDIGPRLLLATPHHVVATGHHRAAPAIHDVIATFRGNADAAHRFVERRRIGFVALCPALAEARIYAESAPGGFAAQLIAGRPPAWLEPVAVPGDGSLRVWRVVG